MLPEKAHIQELTQKISEITNLNQSVIERLFEKALDTYTKAKEDYSYIKQKCKTIAEDIGESGRTRTNALNILKDTVKYEVELENSIPSIIKAYTDLVKTKSEQTSPVNIQINIQPTTKIIEEVILTQED